MPCKSVTKSAHGAAKVKMQVQVLPLLLFEKVDCEMEKVIVAPERNVIIEAEIICAWCERGCTCTIVGFVMNGGYIGAVVCEETGL